MSRMDKLITELCLEGVEYKTLGIVGEFIRGNGLQKKDLTDSGVGAIHYGQVYTHYGIWATETKSYVSPEFAKKLRKAKTGDLVIATTSENDMDVCKAVAWLGKADIAVSGDAYIYRHTLEPKYVAYFFQSEQFQSQKIRHITGTKVKRISGGSMAKFRIPIPPLDVQREIVKVLDTFAQLEAELETELETELEARQRQYHYYRDTLLSFADQSDIHWATLGDICQINRGRVMSKDYLRDHTGPYPVYSSQTANEGVFGFIDTFDYDFESITWTTDGAKAGSVFYHRDKKFSITNVCGLLKVLDSNQVSTRFLYYLLGQLTKRHVSEGMGNPKLMSNAMSRIRVPIPPLSEQSRIVAILDKFDALVNDLSSSLPAEIKARRQQYTHYRDRLLSFREAV